RRPARALAAGGGDLARLEELPHAAQVLRQHARGQVAYAQQPAHARDGQAEAGIDVHLRALRAAAEPDDAGVAHGRALIRAPRDPAALVVLGDARLPGELPPPR